MYIFEAHYIKLDSDERITRKIEFDGQFLDSGKVKWLLRRINNESYKQMDTRRM